MKLYQHAKNQFILFAHSSDNSISESHHMTGHTQLMPAHDHASSKKFQSPFDFHKCVQACRKSVNLIGWPNVSIN